MDTSQKHFSVGDKVRIEWDNGETETRKIVDTHFNDRFEEWGYKVENGFEYMEGKNFEKVEG